MKISARTLQAEKRAGTKTLRQKPASCRKTKNRVSGALWKMGSVVVDERQYRTETFQSLRDNLPRLLSFFEWVGKPLEDLSRDDKHAAEKKKKKNIIPMQYQYEGHKNRKEAGLEDFFKTEERSELEISESPVDKQKWSLPDIFCY